MSLLTLTKNVQKSCNEIFVTSASFEKFLPNSVDMVKNLQQALRAYCPNIYTGSLGEKSTKKNLLDKPCDWKPPCLKGM